MLGFMQGKIAKWWMPDDVVFVDEIPHTATGKIQKIDAAPAVQGLPAADDRSGGMRRRVAPGVRADTSVAGRRAEHCKN